MRLACNEGSGLNSLKGGYIGVYIGFRIWGLGSKLLKGVYIGDYKGDYFKGDTMSLDYGSHEQAISE